MTAVPRSRRQGLTRSCPIIEAVCRQGLVSSRWPRIWPPIIAGFARLESRAGLLLAIDPFHYGGRGRRKRARRWCVFRSRRNLHLPVVYLMDCPGLIIVSIPNSRNKSPCPCAPWPPQPDHRSLVHHHRAQLFWRRRCRASQGTGFHCAMLASAYWGSRRWEVGHRGGLSRRHRRRRRS